MSEQKRSLLLNLGKYVWHHDDDRSLRYAGGDGVCVCVCVCVCQPGEPQQRGVATAQGLQPPVSARLGGQNAQRPTRSAESDHFVLCVIDTCSTGWRLSLSKRETISGATAVSLRVQHLRASDGCLCTFQASSVCWSDYYHGVTISVHTRVLFSRSQISCSAKTFKHSRSVRASRLAAGGHRALMFSQSTRFLDVVQDYLDFRHYECVHGTWDALFSIRTIHTRTRRYERLDGSVCLHLLTDRLVGLFQGVCRCADKTGGLLCNDSR